jgi:KaiC/GvpD/RAD55 family RecA-like ATPase
VPPRKPALPTPSPAARSVGVRSEDLALAEKDALLQLKIGRSAHLYAIGISAALAFAGILLLLLFPLQLNPSSTTHGAAEVVGTFYLLIPLLGGLVAASIGLAVKWEAFQLWPWEPHFSTTVGALALNVALAVVYSLRVLGVGPLAGTALYPWFLPLEFLGIGLAFLGLALTWSPWDGRHAASGFTALLPLVTTLLVYYPPSTTAGPAEATAVALVVSALLYQTSGSLLHLVSSGTPSHARALSVSGQNRIVRLAADVREKEQALLFRETAVVRREADVENAEASVRRQKQVLSEARQDLDDTDRQVATRSDQVAIKERELAGKAAEIDAQTRRLADREKSLLLREQELTRQAPLAAAREQRLAQREGELARRDAELASQEQEITQRGASLPQSEARLEARRKEIEAKTAELLRREGEVASREAAVRPKGVTPAASGRPASAAVPQDTQLRQLKAALDEQNANLGRRAKELGDREQAFAATVKKTADRAAAVAAGEAALRHKEADLAERLKEADARRAQYEGASQEYKSRLEEFGRQQVDTAKKGADIDRTLQGFTTREKALTDREKAAKSAAEELERRERELLARERAVAAGEAEVSLRRQEIARASGELAEPGAEAPPALGRPGGFRIASVPPRPPSARPATRPDAPPTPQSSGSGETLEAKSGRRYKDRVPSGTPRLDDLLLGGLPPRSHGVLLGDAFVGKEVVLYSFIGEGLKRGERVILITAARSAEEVAQSLGIVLPQFLEFEQLGKVTWIDASGTGTPSTPQRIVVKGPDDREGILTNLVQATKAMDGGRAAGARVGFLGLSAVLAHTDERASLAFLQNVVGILKPRATLALYALEAGALTEAQVEALLGRMDGAIVFRQDRDRTYLSVRGFGDAETRDWVECRATNRALIVGSLALERIR